jgi:hypothetical protein
MRLKDIQRSVAKAEAKVWKSQRETLKAAYDAKAVLEKAIVDLQALKQKADKRKPGPPKGAEE